MSATAKASVDERTTALEAEITALKRELSSLKGEEVAEPPGVSREESVLHPVRGRELNETEKNHDERIRTLCFVIMASAVVYYLVLTLREVLVPFFLALAIKYMLSPLINVLSCDKRAYPQCDKWRWRMHRGLAICIAMVLAAGPPAKRSPTLNGFAKPDGLAQPAQP